MIVETCFLCGGELFHSRCTRCGASTADQWMAQRCVKPAQDKSMLETLTGMVDKLLPKVTAWELTEYDRSMLQGMRIEL
jgi:hypothetical protein